MGAGGREHGKRTIVRAVVWFVALGCLGAILSVAVAVAAASLSPLTRAGIEYYDSLREQWPRKTPPASLRWFVPGDWIEYDVPDGASYSLIHTRYVGPACEIHAVVTHQGYYGATPAYFGDRMALGMSAGWPWACLRSRSILARPPRTTAQATLRWEHALGETQRTLDIDPMGVGLTVYRPIPADVRPVPMALNSAVYAGAVWLIWFAQRTYRRYRRLMRGGCPLCGYDLEGLELCPECGWSARRAGAPVGA